MQLSKFEISGLFGELKHEIQFPVPKEEEGAPSLVIIHGRNGVGKTTVLRMLDGLLRLDFDEFRKIPFAACSVEFDTGEKLEIKALREKKLAGIEVLYLNKKVVLHPEHSGAISEKEIPKVAEFRELFFKKTDNLIFEFIDTERLYRLQDGSEEVDVFDDVHGVRRVLRHRSIGRTIRQNPKARVREHTGSVASRVKRFIEQAQVNYRTFFSTTEPDLFPRIIERLTATEQPIYEVNKLREQVETIHRQDQENARLELTDGLFRDYRQRVSIVADDEFSNVVIQPIVPRTLQV